MDPVEQASNWLHEQAKERGLSENFRASYVRTDGDWMHFAVKLNNVGDSSHRAILLQEMEDAWDTEHTNNKWHLLLIPSAG